VATEPPCMRQFE